MKEEQSSCFPIMTLDEYALLFPSVLYSFFFLESRILHLLALTLSSGLILLLPSCSALIFLVLSTYSV